VSSNSIVYAGSEETWRVNGNEIKDIFHSLLRIKYISLQEMIQCLEKVSQLVQGLVNTVGDREFPDLIPVV